MADLEHLDPPAPQRPGPVPATTPEQVLSNLAFSVREIVRMDPTTVTSDQWDRFCQLSVELRRTINERRA